MTHRQTGMLTEWLIVESRLGDELWSTVRKLPRGTGVLVLQHDFPPLERQKLVTRLRRIARVRQITICVEGPHRAARVHTIVELRRALAARIPLILLSPMFPTRSHPDWEPLQRMRAATLAALANRQAIALGGMNRRRFAAVRKLGFVGWAGIDAWIRT